MNSPRQKETGNCLHVPAAQPTPGKKRIPHKPLEGCRQFMRMAIRSKAIAGNAVDLRSPHLSILMDEVHTICQR
jgi:hypothetical protein